MKVVFTRQEVEEIIFVHVHREFHEEFNTIDFCEHSEDEYVTVFYSNKGEKEKGSNE